MPYMITRGIGRSMSDFRSYAGLCYVSQKVIRDSGYAWRMVTHMLSEALEDTYGDICVSWSHNDIIGLCIYFSHTGAEGDRMHSMLHVEDNGMSMLKFIGMHKNAVDMVIDVSSTYAEAKSCIDCIIRKMSSERTYA